MTFFYNGGPGSSTMWLQANIEYCFYESGHMVYAKDASLQQLHDNVADFIRRTSRSAQ